jgi:hypothetical protein
MRNILLAGAVALLVAPTPGFAQLTTTFGLPAQPGTGGGYAGELTGPGTIGANGSGIMGSPGRNAAWLFAPAGPSSLTGRSLLGTGSVGGGTGGYPAPQGRAILGPG